MRRESGGNQITDSDSGVSSNTNNHSSYTSSANIYSEEETMACVQDWAMTGEDRQPFAFTVPIPQWRFFKRVF